MTVIDTLKNCSKSKYYILRKMFCRLNHVSDLSLSWREKKSLLAFNLLVEMEIMLVHLDEVHEPVHNTLPVPRPAVLEVDQCGVNVVTPGSEKQTLKINN